MKTSALIPAPIKTAIICATYITLANMLQLYAADTSLPAAGTASWYGEDHRGRLMANGRPFNPDKLTAASWFYPLGTRVRVSTQSARGITRQVFVTITDRGPAKELVRGGRIIDLTHAAFKRLADPDLGLIDVRVEPITFSSSTQQANDQETRRSGRRSARDRVG